MDGYVIVGEVGSVLSKNLYWVGKKVVKAHVFSVKATKNILDQAKRESWPFMPTQIIPTHYAKGKDVEVIGAARPAYQ